MALTRAEAGKADLKTTTAEVSRSTDIKAKGTEDTVAAAAKTDTDKKTTAPAEKKTAKTAEKKTEAPKKEAEKTTAKAAKKTASRKTAKKSSTKKSASKKAAKKSVAKPERKVVLQYLGKEEDVDVLTERAQAQFAAEHPSTAVKQIALYLKPEDGAAYYVINDTYAGKVEY